MKIERKPIAVAATLAAGLALAAAGIAGGPVTGEQEASLFAKRGGHAVVTFEQPAAGPVELRGRLVDAATEAPLGETDVKVVRFAVAEAAETTGAVTVEELDQELPPYDVLGTTTVRTADRGEFQLSKLAPGSYSLQLDWDRVTADAEVVRWDLRWVGTERADKKPH